MFSEDDPSKATASTESLEVRDKPSRREIIAWASYDIANATYATVVATAVYNRYFVDTVAKSVDGAVVLTCIIAVAALMIVVTAPLLGSIADATASKKKFLFVFTAICVCATALLSTVLPGQWMYASVILIVANFAFGTAEDFVASFLPELATPQTMGKISAFGWAAGYIGGLFSLGGCFVYFAWAHGQNLTEPQYVPIAMLICAFAYAVASTPTFVWLKERATPDPELLQQPNFWLIGFQRLQETIRRARHYRDLFSFLFSLFVYSCGTTTVLHMAAVYATEQMGFTAQDTVALIFVVDITAAIGATCFGFIQDRIGSIKTLGASLVIWAVAIAIATTAQGRTEFWIAANLVGICMGATGSVGRALVGQFSPAGRSGEFLGLWGVAVKLATAFGALSFGAVMFLTHHNYRIALASQAVFFLIGLLLLLRVNERRGILAAQVAEP